MTNSGRLERTRSPFSTHHEEVGMKAWSVRPEIGIGSPSGRPGAADSSRRMTSGRAAPRATTTNPPTSGFGPQKPMANPCLAASLKRPISSVGLISLSGGADCRIAPIPWVARSSISAPSLVSLRSLYADEFFQVA
jgi:hypothetical protein